MCFTVHPLLNQVSPSVSIGFCSILSDFSLNFVWFWACNWYELHTTANNIVYEQPLNHRLVANIWGNMNSRLSYLITTVLNSFFILCLDLFEMKLWTFTSLLAADVSTKVSRTVSTVSIDRWRFNRTRWNNYVKAKKADQMSSEMTLWTFTV